MDGIAGQAQLKFIPLYFFKKSTTGQAKVSPRFKIGIIIRLSLVLSSHKRGGSREEWYQSIGLAFPCNRL
jgi:hypothetical protein